MKHHKAKAPDAAVIEAVKLWDDDEGGYLKISRTLSAKYGVEISKSTVRDWVRGWSRGSAWA